jgi:protein-disulfide isomerase
MLVKLRIIFLAFFYLLGIAQNLYAADGWVADEIFLQMSEMKQQIHQLQVKVADLEMQIASKPGQQGRSVSLAGNENMTQGAKNAPLAIVEFSDYECPFCAKHYHTVLPKLQENYIKPGKLKYVMKDFPLEFHKHAKQASLSGRCAGLQGQYWPMHDLIIEAKGQVSEQFIADAVSKLELDNSAFSNCMVDAAQLALIQQDIELGSKLGVSGTPAFLIGKVKNNQLVDYKLLVGVQSYEAFAGTLEKIK